MNNILLILSSVLLNAGAQLLIRKGMLQVGEVSPGHFLESVVPMLINFWLWGAMICYVLSFALWLSVLSKMEVSYAYPFLSVGYILTSVAGYVFFNESLSVSRITGIIIICIGVFLISKS